MLRSTSRKMAKPTSKNTCSIEMALPDRDLIRAAQSGRGDPSGFIESLGGVRCRNRKELEIATDAHLLEGVIRRAGIRLDSLVRKARKAGLCLRTVAA